MTVEGKRVLVTGGTGSLGRAFVRRLLSGLHGRPKSITVYSRDEVKQHNMRLEFQHHAEATDDIIYRHAHEIMKYRIGDIRDSQALLRVVRDTDIVVHAAAFKQVPTCEYFPYEAVLTNVVGAQNLVDAVCNHDTPVERVVGISTDKACKPVNVMGMTKAIQERILIEANLHSRTTEFVCVRYGNVIASRGSVVPLFAAQIRAGGPVTITVREMTRFLLDLERAVDTAMAALMTGRRGDTYVPKLPSARLVDVARALMIVEGRTVPIRFIGIRPGEKVHEILVSEEESARTDEYGDHYVISPIVPELRVRSGGDRALPSEYSSSTDNVSVEELCELLHGATSEIAAYA